MSAAQIVITGRGLITPVGLSTAASCAALRAGIARLQELPAGVVDPATNEEKPICGGLVPIAGLADEPESSRVARLAQYALAEALHSCLGNKPPKGEIGLYLGLDDQEDAAPVLAACRDLLPQAQAQPVTEGRCAGLLALHAALRALQQGQIAAAVVGGVDSLIRPTVLLQLQEKEMLQSPTNPRGIVPGEGAGFLVLETAEEAERRGVLPQAQLLAAALADEPTAGTEEVNQAMGLTTALRQAITEAGGLQALRQAITEAGGLQAPPLVICDLNGDRYRALEWAFAAMRTIGHLQGEVPLFHPADCLGDAGAASGLINLMWASEALAKGYARAERALIWGASENCKRAAAILAPCPPTQG